MTLPSEINLYISIPLLFHHPNSYQKEKGNFSTQRGINVLLTIPLTDSQHSLFLFASGGKEKGGEKGMLGGFGTLCNSNWKPGLSQLEQNWLLMELILLSFTPFHFQVLGATQGWKLCMDNVYK